MPLPKEPIIFIKPATALIGPGEDIIYPEMSERVDYEAELAIVVGKKCKDVSKEDALNYVGGFTCLNDVTARDLQKKDGQWTRAKGFDTFCPVGPKVVEDIDPNNVKIQSFLNGELKQDSNTSNFIFKVEEVVSFISKIMTLNSGDIIATGTPSGIGPMKKGDKIEVKIEGIGTLRNYVK
jgi:2-keto-4-pentenoate hydratase/2-oxohepta-3-ene-1,7-dioic acid hydratase in catechol pathway